MRRKHLATVLCGAPLLLGRGVAAQSVDGSAIFQSNCVECHDGAPESRAPGARAAPRPRARVDRRRADRRGDALPGPAPDRRRAARRGGVPLRSLVRRRGRRRSDGGPVRWNARSLGSGGGALVERVGPDRHEHAQPAGRGRGADRGRPPQAAPRVGAGLSRRDVRVGAAHRCGRARLRRKPERHGLRAGRQGRVHPVDLRGEGQRAIGRVDRGARRWLGALRGVLLRPARLRVRAGRRDGLGALEHPRGDPSAGPPHGLGRAVRRPPLRAHLVVRGGREGTDVCMLHVPWGHRRARREDRRARLDGVHGHGNAEADGPARRRGRVVGAVRRRDLVGADDRRGAPRDLRGRRKHVQRRDPAGYGRDRGVRPRLGRHALGPSADARRRVRLPDR